jgi:hypothetical protein
MIATNYWATLVAKISPTVCRTLDVRSYDNLLDNYFLKSRQRHFQKLKNLLFPVD